MIDKNISDGKLHSVDWVNPQGWDFGALGCPGSQHLFFSNMVMWHIKSTGMTIRTEFKYPRIKLVTMG